MQKLLMLGLVGFVAQLIDGALGMAYGVTSTTLLVTTGVAPAAASASVHLAEVGTTLASGAAHWKFGNINWRVVALMTVPGAFFAFLGAVALSSISAETAVPLVSAFLFCLGVYILVRFARSRIAPPNRRPLPWFFLAPLGGFAGFMDAAGGGGWGPIGTTSLLSSGRMEPRQVVGSVDAAEFLVSVGASAGFLVALDSSELHAGWLVALLAGGLVAAPIAAWLVRRLPARILGTAVGGLILVTNARTFGEAVGADAHLVLGVVLALAAVWVAAVAAAVAGLRRDRQLAAEAA
ncbi:MAG TPA: sulfite exporter TauE/SafE family protein [Thermoleophilaceae bacterium]|nr:sulfite exporter TauE/SafE family protein [Thermoleophilaceae bacterium]